MSSPISLIPVLMAHCISGWFHWFIVWRNRCFHWSTGSIANFIGPFLTDFIGPLSDFLAQLLKKMADFIGPLSDKCWLNGKRSVRPLYLFASVRSPRVRSPIIMFRTWVRSPTIMFAYHDRRYPDHVPVACMKTHITFSLFVRNIHMLNINELKFKRFGYYWYTS